MSACLTCRTVVARVASTGEPWTCGDCGSQHHPPSVTAPSVEDLEVSRLRARVAELEKKLKATEAASDLLCARVQSLWPAVLAEEAFAAEASNENARDPDGLGGGYICGTPELSRLRDEADTLRQAALRGPSHG